MHLTAQHLIGRTVDEIETPALVVDLEVFEANVAFLARFCRDHGVDWRPHSKSHKSPQVARILLAAGATGLTCAKLSEVEVFVDYGVSDLLLANQLATPTKLERLARIQGRARVLGIVDAAEAVDLAGRAGQGVGLTIPLLVDVDIGMHRTGVPPGDGVVELARRIDATAGTELAGIMGFEGHVLDAHPAPAKEEATRAALDHLTHARQALERAELPCPVVSAGSTATYALAASHPGVTEIQAGGAIFMDAMYRHRFHIGEELGYALTVVTTVTGRHADHVVLDAGFKTLSAFHNEPEVLGRDDLEFGYLSAEHGIFRLRPGATGPDLGERLTLLPGYGDSTTCLHDVFLAVRDGRVEQVWELTARGALT